MKQKFYETTDLALVAYLKLYGFIIQDVRKKDRRAVFIFEDRPTREKLIREFYSENSTTIPLEFLH